MSILINMGAVLTGIILIVIIFNLMVNKKMSESQSVLWLLIGIVTIIIGLFPRIINITANKLGVWYPPSLIFVIAYVGLLFIVFKTTVMTSVQTSQINELFMEVILIKEENEKLKKELNNIKLEDIKLEDIELRNIRLEEIESGNIEFEDVKLEEIKKEGELN